MSVKCAKCNKCKPPNEFMSKDRTMKCCKTCLEKRKDCYEKNTEKLLKQQKVYNEEHAEKLRKQQKVWRENRKITDPLNTKFNRMIYGSIQSDTNSNRPYEPTDFIDEEFLNYLWSNQNQQCFHCNCIMTLEFTTNPTKVSIQRINNDLPHIRSNCVLSCFRCNVNHMERTGV